MWVVRQRRYESLLAEFRDMQNLYWESTSEVVDLRIDLANAAEQIARLEGKTTVKATFVNNQPTNIEPIVFDVVESDHKRGRVR